MPAASLSLEQHLLQLARENEQLKTALLVTRCALEYVADESAEPVMVENARVALDLTAEAAGAEG